VYCTADILLPLKSVDGGVAANTDTTLVAVAELLVMVQAILMLQKKKLQRELISLLIIKEPIL